MFFKFILLVCIVFVSMPSNAIAGKEHAKNFISSWGVNTANYTCYDDWIAGTDWCIYPKVDGKCVASNDAAAESIEYPDDEYVRGMFVAYEINANGAYFCPTELVAANKNKSWSWTESRDLGGKCYWVCRDGYSGEKCQSTTSVACAADEIDPQHNLAHAPADKANNEDFIANKTNKCGTNTKEEHDVILVAIPTPDKHGFWAQPMMFRSKHSDWKEMKSYVYMAPLPGGNVYTLCRPGYTVQKDPGGDYRKNVCVPIDKLKCDTANTTFCAGFPAEHYDPSIHTQIPSNGCIKYICANDGMAFTTTPFDTNKPFGCEPCSSLSAKYGRNSETGFCTQCQTGEIFNTDTNKCQKARALSKMDLMYGVGKTKITSDDIDKQCWTKVDITEYQKCMRGE